MPDKTSAFPFEIEFVSELAYLDLVYNISNEITEVLKLDKKESMQLSVAVSEAVTNAIVHGNRNDASKKVCLAILMEPTFLRIDITDEGDGSFRYDSSKHGLMNEKNLELEGGRGIFIMKNYIDRLEYSQAESRGTRVSLIKYLSKEVKPHEHSDPKKE